jgi:hypothetical protein
MARRLSASLWRTVVQAGSPWQRRTGASALAVGVIVVHGCVADRIAEQMSDFSVDMAMPPRIEVAYVREMEPSAPPVAAPAPPAPVAPKTRRTKGAAASASAPAAMAPAEPEAPPPEPAPAPPPPEPAPVVAAAASAPTEPLVVASAVSAASAVDSPNTTDRFAWPGSTKVSYVLTGNYRGEIHGTAQVEWIRVGLRYQMNLDVTVGLPFAPLYQRRMTSEGQLTPQGLMPERYDEESKVAFKDPRRYTLRFEPDSVLLPDGSRRERWLGMQDSVSQFPQLTYLFTTHPALLAAGNTIEMPLALAPRSVKRWTYDVLEPETLATPFGAVDTLHLKPRSVSTKAGGDLSVEIWFAPALAYLPARIRIQQDVDTFLDLMIKRKPQLAQQ